MASTSSLIIISIPPILLLVAIVVILFVYYEPAQEWLNRTLDSGYSLLLENVSFLNRIGVPIPPHLAPANHYQDLDYNDDAGGQQDNLDPDNEHGEEEDPEATGTTTSARLRMHHELVQQMRVRAGFAPEPFPDDVQGGEDGEEEDDDGDGNEEDGGVGSSTGATAAAPRIKKIGKKKAKSLQRREQMRAYHEFMGAQREERRQQEELFNMQQSIQQEERQRQRKVQQEREQRLKEQQKIKEAKVNQANLTKKKREMEKQVQTRRELRTFIHNVKSFRMADLVKRFGRSETLLLKDLEAIAGEDATQTSESSPRIILRLPVSPMSPSSPGGPSLSSSRKLDSFPEGSKVVLFDQGSGMYLVLEKSVLEAFAQVIQENGKISKQDLSISSHTILRPITTDLR